MLSQVLPALFVLVCTDGHYCSPERDMTRMPMPDWETCQEAAKNASAFTPPSDKNQNFSVTVFCAGHYSNE